MDGCRRKRPPKPAFGVEFGATSKPKDARLNTVMKKLSGWAAIIAVPTAITGFYGQNVPYPGS